MKNYFKNIPFYSKDSFRTEESVTNSIEEEETTTAVTEPVCLVKEKEKQHCEDIERLGESVQMESPNQNDVK